MIGLSITPALFKNAADAILRWDNTDSLKAPIWTRSIQMQKVTGSKRRRPAYIGRNGSVPNNVNIGCPQGFWTGWLGGVILGGHFREGHFFVGRLFVRFEVSHSSWALHYCYTPVHTSAGSRYLDCLNNNLAVAQQPITTIVVPGHGCDGAGLQLPTISENSSWTTVLES